MVLDRSDLLPTVLITGANRGLGLEFARQYAAEGWRVIACCRHRGKASELEALAESARVSVETLNLSDFDTIDTLRDRYRDIPIDVLLNNAGVIGAFPIAENVARQHFGAMDYELWQDVMHVNTFAPLRMAEAFLQNLAASREKKLVAISSTVASMSESAVPSLAYASSKAALNRVMTIIAEQLRDSGISVGLYCPGYVRTRMDAWGFGEVEVSDSVTALRARIAELNIDNSGGFTRYDGTSINW